MALVAAAAAAAGGVAWRTMDGPRPAPAANSSTSPTPTVDVAAQSAAVDAILSRRAQAVLRRDRRLFLADVDPSNAALVARQNVLYANLVQFGFGRLSYRQGRTQFDQALVDRHGPTVYLVGVVMNYQIRGIDPHPLRTMVGYTFAQRAGRWLLIDDDDLDGTLPDGSHREPWDTGPVLVRRAPGVLVVVEPGSGKLAGSLAADARSGIQAVSRHWPPGWQGSAVVIALDDLKVRSTDYTTPKRADQVLASATSVYRTLPGEVRPEGERGGSYVVINPRHRREVDARTFAHEFTHVATAPYGSNAPRWMVEGTAEYVESLPMPGERDYDLDRYRRLVRSKYLAKMKQFPADGVFYDTMRPSYAVGWLAMDYLFDRYGGAKVARLYEDMARRGFTQTQRDLVLTEHLGVTEAGLFRELKSE